jgi:hypothetical protein
MSLMQPGCGRPRGRDRAPSAASSRGLAAVLPGLLLL